MSFDRALFSTKVRRYREQFGLSVDDLAARMGIPTQRIQDLEDQTSEPSGDEVLVLADVFKCDYKYFLSADAKAPIDQTEALFRRHGAEFTPSDRWAVQEVLYLAEVEEDTRDLLGRPRRFEFSFEKRGTYLKGHAEEAASALREHLRLGPLEVPRDIFTTFRQLGLHVFRRKLENSNISGLMLRHPRVGPCLLINYGEDVFRQRFTVAHEAAHAILDDGQDYVVSFSTQGKDHSEMRANHFASHFLLPTQVLEQITQVGQWSSEKASLWAQKLMVSTHALSIALKREGLVTEAVADVVKRTRVPKSSKIDPELPPNLPPGSHARAAELLRRGLSRSYVELCIEAFQLSVISAGRLADALLLEHPADLAAVLRLYQVGVRHDI